MKNNLKKLIHNIIDLICDEPEVVEVEIISMATNTLHAQVLCSPHDMKFVIGSGGRNVQSIRTILHSIGARDGLTTSINIKANP